MTITPFWKAGAEQGDTKEFDFADDNVVITTSVVYTGLRSFKFNVSTYGTYMSKNIASSQLRIGQYVRPGALHYNDGISQMIRIRTSASDLVNIRMNGLVGLEFLINNVVVSSANLPTLDVWQHWGLDWKASSTDGWAHFYINGEPILSFNGDTGSAPSNHVRWGWNATNQWFEYMYMDDLYIDISEGEPAPAPLPGKRFIYRKPISDVVGEFTPSTGTGHFSLLNDVPVSSASYVRAGVSDKKDLFLMEPIVYPEGYRATAIWPTASARKSNPDIDSRIKLMITDGITNVQGDSQTLGVTSGSVSQRFGTQPNGEAWNDDAANAIVSGFASSGTF